MDFQILITNLTNPTLLFFVLGIIAALIKSDLEIPQTSVKFISLYLLFAIGFKGGQQIAISHFNTEIFYALLFGLFLSAFIPYYTFYILKQKLSISDAGAVAAAYGSVSAVTFVAAVSFIESINQEYSGHMVAVMAFMEAPAIVVGVSLINRYDIEENTKVSLWQIIKHSITNGSVVLVLGSLFIGLISDIKQAEGIKPFTNDIFKGFLAIFLLEMGMVTTRRFGTFKKYGLFATLFAILIPLFNGVSISIISGLFIQSNADRLIFAILAASASYIAVPAAMRIAAPKADPGLYIPMALGVTFPFNISIGMPIYYYFVNLF